MAMPTRNITVPMNMGTNAVGMDPHIDGHCCHRNVCACGRDSGNLLTSVLGR